MTAPAVQYHREAAVAAAELELRARQRARLRPHTEYQNDPVGWMVDKLGIPEHTIRWSLNEGYEGHVWDGTPDPLVAALEAIARWENVAVESGTGCLQGDAVIGVHRAGKGFRIKLRDLVARFNGRRNPGQPARAWDLSLPTYVQREVNGVMRLGRLQDAWCSGVKMTYTVTTESGRQLRGTDEHPFLTERGWLRLDQLLVGDEVHVLGDLGTGKRAPKRHYRMTSGLRGHPYAGRRDPQVHHPYRHPTHRLVAEAELNGLPMEDFIAQLRDGESDGLTFLDPVEFSVHHRDNDPLNNDPSNLAVLPRIKHHKLHAAEVEATDQAALLYRIRTERVASVEPYGEEETFDLSVADAPHNFIANGLVVHNTGKTYTLGAAEALWFLACFENSIVITTAPKEDHLKKNLWKEIRTLWPRFKLMFPTAVLSDGKIRMKGGLDETWAANAQVAGVGADEESANKARGSHAKDMLFIVEEMPGMDSAVVTAIKNTSTAPHNLIEGLGNPDNEQDQLHGFAILPSTTKIRISALDHPNVVTGNADLIPGAVSQKSINGRRDEYGEGSTMFNAMVRGIAPKESSEAVIRWAWLEEAAKRYSDLRFRKGLPALGVDVADTPNGDKIAIARGIGACLMEVSAFQVGTHGVGDAGELGEQIALEIALGRIDERHVAVDTVGVGASTYNSLKKQGFLVQSIKGGGKPMPAIDEDVLDETGKGIVPEELFHDLNSQIQWQMRQDLQHGRIALPYDEELFRDLTSRKWERHNGKIRIQSKETVVKELGRSPDKGDAAVMWNAVRHRRALPAPQEEQSAWSPEVLEFESREGRRVKSKPEFNRQRVPITALESVD